MNEKYKKHIPVDEMTLKVTCTYTCAQRMVHVNFHVCIDICSFD